MRDVRAKYIAAFHEVLHELETEGRRVTPEVRVEVNLQASHELYRLLVVDVLEQKPDGTVGAIEINCDEIATSHGGLHIEAPVVWNGVVLKCRKEGFSENGVLAWGNRWILDESPPLGPQDGLTGVIHSVTQPEIVSDAVEFSVDFGSAPFQAFEELLACLGSSILAVGNELTDRGA